MPEKKSKFSVLVPIRENLILELNLCEYLNVSVG